MVSVTRQGNMIAYTLLAGAGAVALLVRDHLRTPFDSIFDEIGSARNVDSNLLRAIARRESNFRAMLPPTREPNGTLSYGLMQINDTTAKTFGIDPSLLKSPYTNVDVAARLLIQNRHALGGSPSVDHEISAYNEGPGTLLKRGILDSDYVAVVKQHYYLYSLGRMFA
jgi:soluble lytic murein transglycosylase-like protein